MRKAFFFLSLLACCSASAQITITLREDTHNGNDGVMLSYSGSADLTGLTPSVTSIAAVTINLQYGTFVSTIGRGAMLMIYSGITGPTSVGIGSGYYGGAYLSGDPFGLVGSLDTIYFPEAYSSGDWIAGESFFRDATLIDMELADGDTYTWTWGAGSEAQRVVLTVIAPVPEPALYASFCAALALAGLLVMRRRRRG